MYVRRYANVHHHDFLYFLMVNWCVVWEGLKNLNEYLTKSIRNVIRCDFKSMFWKQTLLFGNFAKKNVIKYFQRSFQKKTIWNDHNGYVIRYFFKLYTAMLVAHSIERKTFSSTKKKVCSLYKIHHERAQEIF